MICESCGEDTHRSTWVDGKYVCRDCIERPKPARRSVCINDSTWKPKPKGIVSFKRG